MNLIDAIEKYRNRQPLPEEQVLAEQIVEYPNVERCPECGHRVPPRARDIAWWFECLGCGAAIAPGRIASRNHLSEALVTLIAHDAGQPAPDAKDASRPWCEDHDRALLDCLLSLAREVVEHRVILADLKAKIGEAQKLAEVAA